MDKASKEAEHYDYVEQGLPEGRRYSAEGHRVSVVDDVFGEIVDGGPNYRAVSINSRSPPGPCHEDMH